MGGVAVLGLLGLGLFWVYRKGKRDAVLEASKAPYEGETPLVKVPSKTVYATLGMLVARYGLRFGLMGIDPYASPKTGGLEHGQSPREEMEAPYAHLATELDGGRE